MKTKSLTENVNKILQSSVEAFNSYKLTNVKQRADLMRSIAKNIENLGDQLIDITHEETGLSKPRLINEKGRTVNQWRSYAAAIESGIVLDLRIDIPATNKNSIKPDIRKMMIPLGPVGIFGSSNFPFAFSTAGGDTASALAAGNSVIVKMHPAHPKTSKIMGEAIESAIAENGYPTGLFSQVEGEVEIGTELVSHPSLKAVGFTGSFQAGKALFDIGNRRSEPIPVFAEMGSVNPLFLLPKKLKSSDSDLAIKYVESLTLGSGQFCTNPGLLVVMKDPELQDFIAEAKMEISKKSAEKMLHHGIASNYLKNSTNMTDHSAVTIIASGEPGDVNSGQAILAMTTASDFLKNEHFCGEVFGPFGLIVECENKQEMENIAAKLDGQLTATLLADEDELEEYINLKSILIEKCGRLILNNFPTGVEVCMAMQHGGPFPSSTDSRFTSVGADAIKRFMRPFSYQNWPDNHLPDELKNDNPLNLLRTINETNSTQSITNL